ncbi:lipid A deacylase LpxR family protein [Luteolibacter sp. Y139]|uniref:Lipid A deacylase LpxR family protein n=2 Tax=Luteolibacter soli TaxID=3135280 RepID=A0ABU9B5Z1_9BACT
MSSAITLLALSFSTVAHADRKSPLPDWGEGYLTFYLDNDLFAHTDRDYTNGARLSWISDDREIKDLGSVQRLLRSFSGDEDSFQLFQKLTGFKDFEKVRYNYGFSLTQLMYTPEQAAPYVQPPGERRYAGWAALGFSLHAKDENVLNSVELLLGTTGSNSLAENAQDFIHSIRGFDKFNGWDYQIPNEITADLSFVQKRRSNLLRDDQGVFQMDGLTEWGGRLGTFRTAAHVGTFFRAGYHLPPDFSDPRLSETAYSNLYFRGADDYPGHWSIYALFGGTARAIAYDATLDGPMFHDFDTGSTREPFVAEVFCGAGIRYRQAELSYVHTWRTQEYEQQREQFASFGSVAVRVRF